MDVWQLWSGDPFACAGMNAILLYVGHELLKGYFPLAWKPLTASHAELLAMDLWGTAVWLAVAYVLYKRGFFLSV